MKLGNRRLHPDKGDSSLVIEQNNVSGRVSYWYGGAHQSVADAHGISLADYIHAIYWFLRQTRARNVLMIGCGGGTLATMLDGEGVNVTVVDIDARSIELARRYFNLPDSVTTHVADGAEFLRRTRGRYDAIVLDAYNGGDFPDVFKKPAYLASVKAHLTGANAIYLENMLVDDDDDRAPDNRARLLQQVWPDVRLLDCDGWVDRNAVIAAGAVRGLRKPKLILRPSRGAKKLERELESLIFRRLQKLMALKKKSFSLSGHRTSVALEAEFWTVLEQEAARGKQSFAGFVAGIDKERGTRPLASALRLAALAAAARHH